MTTQTHSTYTVIRQSTMDRWTIEAASHGQAAAFIGQRIWGERKAWAERQTGTVGGSGVFQCYRRGGGLNTQTSVGDYLHVSLDD